MVRTFFKYFLTVYLLLSGSVAVLYGNSARNEEFCTSESVQDIFEVNQDFLIHTPSQNTQRRSRLFEITEVEESEDEKKALKRSFESRSYLAAFLRDQLLKSFFFENKKKRLPLFQYFPSSLTPKRHIIFEVFLI
ncbi:MAG: hypothetical protein HEP71_09620 [Roseivirga sp.]|nr:hypothetical protein [Roseivirga sp.]